MTQHSIDRRSSSVSSGRKKRSMNAIEMEIDRAYVDTQKKLSHKDLEDEEDIESLFEDDDVAKHASSYQSYAQNKQQRHSHNGNALLTYSPPQKSVSPHRHTLPPKNYANSFNVPLGNPNGHRLYSTSNSHSRSAARAKSPRSVSYGNVMQSQSKSNAFVQPQ